MFAQTASHNVLPGMTYSTLMMYKMYKMKMCTHPMYTLRKTRHCRAHSHATSVLFIQVNVGWSAPPAHAGYQSPPRAYLLPCDSAVVCELF